MFDCVYPTRAGRHGRAITRDGEYSIRNAGYARDERPIDPDCSCMVCATFTRAYVSHLFRSEELWVHGFCPTTTWRRWKR